MHVSLLSVDKVPTPRKADHVLLGSRALLGSVGLLAVLLVQGVTAYSGHLIGLIH